MVKDRDLEFAATPRAPKRQGTLVPEHPKQASDTDSARDRFHRAIKRIRRSNRFSPSSSADAPYGVFNGRPIIGERTRIQGGIFIGALPHESIVVDQKYGRLPALFASLLEPMKSELTSRQVPEREILARIFSLTEQTIRYDPLGVQELAKEERLQPDQKVGLDMFLDAQCGLARHRMLLAAWLVERCITEGYLRGILTLDAELRDGEGEDESLHYVTPRGEIARFRGKPE